MKWGDMHKDSGFILLMVIIVMIWGYFIIG